MTDLSIITPAAPGRFDRIESIFKRLRVNKERHENIRFEFIIVDDSLDQQYKGLSQSYTRYYPVKYVSLPLKEPYPNPSYMRNVGFRLAQGEVFTMIDADHWVHEDFIEGAIAPFREGPVLNTGFMIDTSKGTAGRHIDRVNNALINGSDLLTFADAMATTGIRGPVAWDKVWLAAYPAQTFLQLNGYDEKYTAGYSREDDDIYYRLASQLQIRNGHFAKFAGVHLWHPQKARSDAKNEANKLYYNVSKHLNPIRNMGHEWGKLVKDGYSIIDEQKLDYAAHEKWIYDNTQLDTYVTSQPWEDFEELKKAVVL